VEEEWKGRVVDGVDEGSAFGGGGRVDRFLVLRICRSGMKGMEESSKYNGSASW